MSADATFGAFVGDHRPALLRTALLLTGDRASAEALVQRTLTRARRRWRRPTAGGDPAAPPAAAVRRALVTAATSRRTGPLRTEQVLESLPSGAAPWREREPARVLRELPPRTRAVVVLRWYEGLSPAETAELLGCSLGTVTAEADAGLARLAAALPTGYERAPALVSDEVRVHEELVRLATAPGPWQLDRAAAVADVAGRRRRSRLRLVGAIAVAVCAVGLVVPVARSLPDAAPARGAPPSAAGDGPATSRPPPIAPRSTPVLVGPTRGSLAGDPAFLDAVRRVGWSALVPPPIDQRDVVFAGDTPAGRVVLVTGTVDEDFRGVWLTGPVGAAPESLTVRVPPQLGRDRPLTLVLGGPGPATLVVVAGREDRVEVSDRLRIGPRGTVGRIYEAVESPDGVAVVPVATTSQGTATSVRVSREGRVVLRSAVDWPAAGTGGAVPLPPPRPLRPAAVLPDDGLLAVALTALAVPLGAEPADLDAELLWSGAVPGDRPGTVLVLLARSPGGSRLLSTWARAGAETVPCGVSTPPGDADVAQLTVARICATGPERWLVVSAPPAGVSAEVLDDRERPVATLPLDGGGAVTALPEAADSIRVLDADGGTVTSAPVAPTAPDVFGDYGSGPQR